MGLFSRHRSYTEKVLAFRKKREILAKAALVIIAVACAHSLFLQSFEIDSSVMQPTLVKGDRVLSFPLPVGALTLFGKLPPLSDVKRGELIIVAPDPIPTESWWFRAWDGLVRLFTLQRISPFSSRYGKDFASPGVYRVIGIPGDTLRLRESIYEIRPRGASGFSREFGLAASSYSIKAAAASSPMEQARLSPAEYSLGADEFFVACDDRSAFLGSPLWGPIDSGRILGRVVAVFWPLRHLKIP